MDIFLTNNLTNKKEKFVPKDNKNIGMYVCGPTVYDYPHVGNARPLVVFDILYRLLKNNFSNVTYVRNITDIDDKIIKSSQEQKISTKQNLLNFFCCHLYLLLIQLLNPLISYLIIFHNQKIS